MRIQCRQCGRYVTPDLPEFEFNALVMCGACAEENASRVEQGAEGFLETEAKPLPHLTDIMGEQQVPVRRDAIEALRTHVEGVLSRWADEFLQALPVLRSAFQAMDAAQRIQFVNLVSAVLRVEDEARVVENPFAAFGVKFQMNVLEPADVESPYAGMYAGRGWQGITHWLDLLSDATAAWMKGEEYAPTRDECIQRLMG